VSATGSLPLLSDELLRLRELITGADSVELKLTVPELAHRSTTATLGLDPLDAQIRHVYFFDTAELALDKQGLVVRARRIQGKGDDSVVKLRPVVPNELPARIRKLTGFRVEVDALPGGYVCSATLKRPLDRDAVRSTIAGDRPLRKLFSKEQRAFYGDHEEGGIALDDLLALGPILVLKLQFAPKDLGRRLVAELWTYPDGSRVLELSTRTGTGDAFQVAAEVRAFLASRQVDVSGEQETKTRKALAYFARTMTVAAG